jgi:transposase InsO family protein
MKEQHSIRKLCQVLQVSSSGYYDWAQRQSTPSGRVGEDQALVQKIRVIHQNSRATYGSPRIQRELREAGHGHSRRRIHRLMRQMGICGRQRRRYRLRTTDSNHEHPIAPNHLLQAPPINAPNQVWVADVTYIDTRQGWLFLAAILDLYSRKVVGWAMSEHNDTALVLAALTMALTQRRPPVSLLFHSDQGAPYASSSYRQALDRAGLRASMSRKGNCYDNAVIESFWSTLKWELVYRHTFFTRAQAQAQIFDYIEVFYNRQRLHSSLAYHSPVDFELLNN